MSKGIEFVNRWMEAVTKGDVERLVAMCQPDVDLVNPDGSEHGPDGVRAVFEAIITGTSERAVEIRNIVEEGETVVADFVFRFRNTGPLETPQGAIPATGKQASLPSIATYVLRDGKLAFSHGEYDRMSLLAQLGLLPAPVPAS